MVQVTSDLESSAPSRRIALIQVLVLLGLIGGAFFPQLRNMASLATQDIEAAHAYAAPFLILIVFLFSRRSMSEALGSGSRWGIALMLLSLLVLTVASFPYNYGYIRWIALVPAAAGAVLAVAGRRVLLLSLPLLLLLCVAIPMGSRYYAFLIIKPETITLSTVADVLDRLPGVFVDLTGPDFTWARGGEEGTIALGEPHRGASLFFSSAILGVFLTFVRPRPVWQVAATAVAAVPILLVCNFSRLMTWGLVSIYGEAHPLSPVPRGAAVVVSILLAYVLFAVFLAGLSRVVVSDETIPAASPS